jgi:hypothetical protein
VDDYIGSGNQANEAINNLKSNFGLNFTHLGIMVLVIQQVGLANLVGSDCFVSYFEKRNKGITDHYGANSKEMEIMKKLEKRMNIKDRFKLGFQQSEALVTMQRTPNNTFPIYWYRNESIKTVPFPR